MTIRTLLIFTTVAELENMRKTADKLFITQSSISQAIGDIEREYNVVLFDRLKNGLHLTTLGMDVYKYAKEILHLYNELESVLRYDSKNSKIRIGASATVGATILRSIITEMQKKIPNLSYTTLVGNTETVENDLRNSNLDIAVIEGKIKSDDIVCQKITDDKMVLICSPKHRFFGRNYVTIDEIAKEPLIVREEGSGTRRQFTELFKNTEKDLNIVWSCLSPDVIKNAVKENLGISVISARLVYEDLSNGTLWSCNIADAELTRDFRLAYHKDKYFTSTMNAFVEVAKSVGEKF